MQIEFYIRERFLKISQERKNEIKNIVSNKIEETLNKLGAETSILNRIIFAEKERYGEAIQSVDKNEDYSNNEFGVGFGKTIMEGEKSSIILRHEILEALVTVENNKELSIAEELLYYVFQHEIGHAIDNYQRRPIKTQSEVTFEPRAISNYYIEILISEFAANWNSAKLLSKTFYNDLTNSNSENIRNFLEDKGRLKSLPNYTLAQIKYGVSDRIWLSLMQISQLLGVSILHNCELKIPSEIIDEDTQIKIKDVFLQISKTYPLIDEKSKEELYLVWERLYKKEFEI